VFTAADRSSVRRFFLAVLSGLAVLVVILPLAAQDFAVVFMYHRFGETRYPSTNIRLGQFEAHLGELGKAKYNVRPLPEVVAALRSGRELPDRTVAITVDDAYLSFFTEGWPRLKRAGFPVTLFVATEPVDAGSANYMSWDQIRILAREGVTIGSQTASHLHMPNASAERNAADLAASNARFKAELGAVPTLFAYPYGEYGLAVQKVVEAAGFEAAFGQHSGVAYAAINRFFLPRFAMNESYGDIGRFRLTANALPLRVRDITPADPVLTAANNPPNFGFTMVGDAVRRIDRLACYSPGDPKIERLGRQRIEVRLTRKLPVGRTRINCTMPAGDGRWRWFGMQFFVPSR
jgi:poly-beta-1,6-N-acetyl-D-glucosamine N-deacetylase